MDNRTALLDACRMGETDRMTVEDGTPAAVPMGNAGQAVAREAQARVQG